MASPAEILAAAHAANVDSGDEAPVAITHKPAAFNDENAFPALGSGAAPTGPSSWGPKALVAMRSKAVQEAFSLDFDSQLNINKAEFSRVLASLKKSTHCSIECTSSQQTRKRTFLLTGEPSAISRAKKEILRKLTKPLTLLFLVPSSTRPAIIGAGGRNLKPILEAHGVKVNIDKAETKASSSDEIFEDTATVTVEGDIQGANEAKAAILAIVDQNTKTVTAGVSVTDSIKPFIEGAIASAGWDLDDVEIDLLTDKVAITGPREKVAALRGEVKELAESLEGQIGVKEQVVPKKFHRFIDVDEIKRGFNVVVEIPDDEDESSTVKFVGERKKLQDAVNLAKTSSTKREIESLNIARAHNNDAVHGSHLGVYFKYTKKLAAIGESHGIEIIAPSYLALLNGNLKEVLVDFVYDKGKAGDAKAARKSVIELVNKLPQSSVRLIGDIDGFFAEKATQDTRSLSHELGVSVIPLGNLTSSAHNGVLVVADSESDDDFGPTQSEIDNKFAQIDQALEEVRSLSKNVVSETISVDSKEQDHVSGPGGSTLRSLKSAAKARLEVFLHSPGADEITIRGLKDEVVKTAADIKQILQDAKDYVAASGYVTELEYPKSVLSRLIGKSGSFVSALREEHGVNIDLAKEEDDSPVVLIKITGIKRNAEEAKAKIISLGKRWADETTETLRVPPQYHRRLIGAKGAYVIRLQDKYNVSIRFPKEGETKNTDVVIRGASKGVKKAHDELQELLKYEIDNGHKSVIDVPAAALSHIIGKSGSNVTSLRDEFGVEIEFHEDDGKSQVEIIGSKNSIKEVEKKIKEIVKEVENTITLEIEVDPKHYRAILGPGGSRVKEILSKAQVPDDTGSRNKLLTIPDKGSSSRVVSSSGDKKYVELIISQIKDIVAQEESSVEEEIVVSQERHGLLIGPGGATRRGLEEEFGVRIQVPKASLKSDKISIKGLPENVANAKEKITKLTADNWAALVEVPSQLHGLLASSGALFGKLRSDYGVRVEHGNLAREASKLASAKPKIPAGVEPEAEEDSKWTLVAEEASPESSKVIPWRLIGKPENAAKAKEYIEGRLKAIEEFNATGYLYLKDRSLFRKIIGLRGATIEKLRSKTNTQVVIPQASAESSNVIVIKGKQEDVEKAKEEILKLVA